jgi:conjugative relaxase-like TrwC/TraI family protein
MAVVHCRQAPYDLYIGRGRDPRTGEPGEWGNPYSHRPSRVPGVIVVATVEEAIERYRRHLWAEIRSGRLPLERLAALDGKTLGCWCAPAPATAKCWRRRRAGRRRSCADPRLPRFSDAPLAGRVPARALARCLRTQTKPAKQQQRTRTEITQAKPKATHHQPSSRAQETTGKERIGGPFKPLHDPNPTARHTENRPVRPMQAALSVDREGMVGVTKIGPRNANYWINAVAEGGEDYYTKPGEAPGEWMGELAGELGLAGEVAPDAYAAALAGQHPGTGQVLVARPAPRKFIDADGRERRLDPILGYDVRFSAPKSVSLLYAVGSPEVRGAVLRAHDEAVSQGVAYLERNACFVQRGHGGRSIEPGAGFLAMAFRHRSSRAGDPALHTHLITANMTRAASDGRWLSLAKPKGRTPFWLHAKAAGHVYQAALRAAVTRELGAEWRAPHNGYADLEGIDRAVIEHFSQRRAEIVEALAERGDTSAAAAEVAAYRTRDRKDYKVDPDTQRSEWISRAAEFDLTSETIDAMLARARRREPQPIRAADLDRALADLEEHHSHFDRRDLLAALANQLREGADSRALERAVDSLIAGEQLIEVHRGAGPLEATYYTTPRLWQLEQGFMATARRGEKAGAAVVDGATLAAVLDRHRYLSAEQAEMVRRLTTGGERIVAVAALPGTGKTTALQAAQEAWAVCGYRGFGVATARSASGELGESAGMPATSITHFLIRVEERVEQGLPALPQGTVIVVDEASTTPTPYLARLADLAEGCEGKLVLIGDPRQIGAVGPGGLYGNVTNEIESIVLSEIRRQRDPVDRHIVKLAHEGRGSDALDVLRMEDRLTIADTLPEALDAQVLDWHKRFAAGEDAVMIARRSRDVAELNARARELLVAEGRVGEWGIVVGGQEFALGDRIVTRVNTSKVSNRERWDVVGVDRAKQEVYLQRLGEEGHGAILDRRYLDQATQAGEPALQHAYALTTYTTQSKTFDSAFALLDSGISREDFTVAISRNRGPVFAYGVAASEFTDPDLGPGTREIEDAAQELRAGAERAAGEYAATEIDLRKRIEHKAPTELASRRAELEARRSAEQESSPAQERLQAIERRIVAGNERLAELARERAGLMGERAPAQGQLSRIEAKYRLAAGQIERLEGERKELRAEVASEPRPTGLNAGERAELAVIEDRLGELSRSQARAARAHPPKLITESLGPRPKDPLDAALWNEGVNAIYSYRVRHGITSASGHPLGPKSRDAARARDRRQSELRLARVQQRLLKQRARRAERVMRIAR